MCERPICCLRQTKHEQQLFKDRNALWGNGFDALYYDCIKLFAAYATSCSGNFLGCCTARGQHLYFCAQDAGTMKKKEM